MFLINLFSIIYYEDRKMFKILVKDLNAMKDWEVYLFSLLLPFETKGTITVLETNEIYYYKTQKIKDGYVIVTY